ncbi:MAG: hypothetical protein H6712_34645 [Myxococcales bacterium]|nr:hypothetical protein [Myxococcales bacterium]MCB9719036.1 hypothetical protein [Myxococcales bacterium]
MAPSIRLSPAQQRALAERHRERLRRCVPWSPALRWKPELEIQGSTYQVLELWPGIAASDAPVDQLEPGQFVDSPSRRFRYCVRLHRAGHTLLTWWGNQVGTVLFDTDVIIPALYQARGPDDPGTGYWGETPWMSLTPAELLTLRPGTRLARGRTIVAGLGLGHQLIEVSRRIQVKRVILVELDQELVDWILPRIRPHLRKPLDVHVGDAYEILPTLRADVALIDIFPGYGDGFRRVAELADESPGIKRFWGWGTSEMTGRAQADR